MLIVAEARPSGIEGTGLFAPVDAERGDVLGRFTIEREITPESPLRPDRGERVDHLAYPDGRTILVAAPERYTNHSCDPNAWERHSSDGIELVARRGIAADEEITVDYLMNNEGGDSWPCACGTARCRGETGVSYFELPAAFRQVYLPLLADWFVERYADRLPRPRSAR